LENDEKWPSADDRTEEEEQRTRGKKPKPWTWYYLLLLVYLKPKKEIQEQREKGEKKGELRPGRDGRGRVRKGKIKKIGHRFRGGSTV